MVASWITPKARKGVPSAIEGRGLIAVEPIAAGEAVAVKGGHVVTTETLRGLPERLQASEVQIADGLHLAALADEEYESVMLFLNHSCEPNVGFGGNIVLVAMRDIAPGEELTTDYALFDDYDGGMECRCGRPSCRGVIGGRDWQRPELQAAYAGYFSWYLEQKIRRQPMPSAVTLIRSERLSDVAEYAYAATAPATSRLIFLAGACPLNEDGSTAAVGDYAGQAAKAVENLRVALADSGASLDDVIVTRVLVASNRQEDLVTAWRVVRDAFGDHDVPSTLMGVTVLGYRDQLVEVEAVAAVLDPAEPGAIALQDS
jgi:enamine deaminase RidA (YjgF/YER057c/UK114 family)